MKNGFHITRLEFVGEENRSSIILKKGLNVIYGPTGTGKSFMFDTINFMFGGKDAPEEIEEIKGFNLIRMEIHTNDQKVYTLQRNIDGGSIKKFDCKMSEIDRILSFETLGSNNNAKKSISKFLLSLSGFTNGEYLIKKNKKNEVQRFSYRNMNHLVMADEVRIIAKQSPVYSWVVQSKTKEQNIFKFLLTNDDDSELQQEKKNTVNQNKEVKLELIQNIIDDTKAELKKLTNKKNNFENYSEDIKMLTSEKNGMIGNINELSNKRSNAWKELQSYNSKELSINRLLKRFTLLESQYDSDRERLIFLSEGNHYFSQLSFERCPVCHQELVNDSDLHFEHIVTDDKVKAFKTEISKINRHKKDLKETVYNLQKELEKVKKKKEHFSKEYEDINSQIEKELKPHLHNINIHLEDILKKHAEFNHLVFLEENLKKLSIRKSEIDNLQTEKITYESNKVKPSFEAAIKDLCSEISNILKEWDFPNSSVSFDYTNYDLFIGNKKRSVYGKGYRAIAFSAFLLGLLKYCFDNKLPHSGIVILDSPLTTYKEEDTPEDKLPEEIQYKFYENLSKFGYQVIVFENKKPQEKVISKINFIEFTKNKKVGRFGFINN
jgi:DNA repair ATPase RecN